MAARLGISSKSLSGYVERGQLPASAYETVGNQRWFTDPDLVYNTVRRIQETDPPKPGRPRLPAQPGPRAPAGDPVDVAWRSEVLQDANRIGLAIERLQLDYPDAARALGAVEAQLRKLEDLIADGARGPVL